ncbi:hypothetical protein [Pseudomonas cichorii]|uniref:hypothetical protein n=1 Tax=Pseudomonas cichorii TaxID=36746 RepID=UPI001C8A0914|nr:hypothetical protein [Pseudomonas cichorii]MBX8483422.1 hypothetical protein [Pseudomonas cichorii]MBX8513656.1 hypothetical protein [Pseudomonas cichorii]MBX8573881.1 hypothetical protein [Pseudomonas cichorii]
MAKYELRLSREDFENDQSPEVVVEFYEYEKVEEVPAPAPASMPGAQAQEKEKDKYVAVLRYLAYVSSSSKDGRFDNVSGKSDVDGNVGHTDEDDQVLIDLAQAFIKIHFE